MGRQTRLVIRVLAVAVLLVGAAILVPYVLDGAALLLAAVRRHWWLIVLVAVAVWALFATAKRR